MPCSLGQLQSIVADLAAQSAIAGFVSGAVASGTFKGAVQGSFTALVFYGTGQAFGQVTVNGAVDPDLLAQAVAARAVAGCVTSVAGGGKCGPGALSAVFSKLATPITGQINAVAGTVVSAVIGGTAAELGGGKFANGAVTGAFGYLFNCLSHPDACTKEDIPEIRNAAEACNGKMACIADLRQFAAEAGLPVPRVSLGQALLEFLGIGVGGGASAAAGPILGGASLGGGVAGGEAATALTTEQAANLARFAGKLPSGAGVVSVDALGDGVMFTATVPGRVPGSYAVYQKIIDGLGRTTDYLKTTVDNLGNVVHTKIKF